MLNQTYSNVQTDKYVSVDNHIQKITTLYIYISDKPANFEDTLTGDDVFKSYVVYATERSKAVVLVLVLLFVALWFILRGDLFSVLPCVICVILLCFQSF